MENKIEIKDNSNDRGYFTIVPNYILNHSTAIAQALYLQLKRLAGENGIAYPGSRYLREKLSISQPTLRKEFKYLLNKKWIEYAGEKEIDTDGGKQKIKSYKIVDLWQLNNKTYQRGEKIDTPYQRGEKIDTQGVKSGGEKIDTKEDPCNKNYSLKKNYGLATAKRTEQSFKKEEYNTILEEYQKLKGIKLQGAEFLPYQQAIKTMFMSGRTKDNIIACMRWLAEGKEEWMENWTLKTAKMKMPEFLAGKMNNKLTIIK